MDRYLNLLTDFGFKKIFGEEPNKDLLCDFLNELLKDREGKIVDLVYLKNEHLGESNIDRKAIYDLYCENERGEKFIVELQKTKQLYFKDRSIYYATFPIQEQAKQGEWNYQLKNIYTIGILDFVFDEDKKDPDKMLYKIKLSDIETGKVFYDKMTFIYIELPKFKKTPDELSTHFEKWLFILKNLHNLSERPATLQDKIFGKLFELAEVSKFDEAERRSYRNSLKYYRDIKNSFDTAFYEGEQAGIEKGLAKGILKIAKEMIRQKIDRDAIVKCTGLSIEDIAKIENEILS